MLVQAGTPQLERCLDTCKDLFDEIVIVNLGASEEQLTIARKFTNKIYPFDFADDYAAARNFSFACATSEYAMWMDPDDQIWPADLSQLKVLKKVLSRNIDAVVMNYNIGFDDHGYVTLSQCRERIIKRAAGLEWQDPIHEFIPLRGNVRTADITITNTEIHKADPVKNLAIYQRATEGGVQFTSHGILSYARDLRAAKREAEAIEAYRHFIRLDDSSPEDYASAFFELSLLYQGMNDYDNMMEVLLTSLKYVRPTPEICSQIGQYHFTRESYSEAIFWYERALGTIDTPGMRLVHHDYLGYIPALQLCLCHFRLGDVSKSTEYNNLARRFKPQDESILTNDKFFAGLKHKKSE